MLVSDLYEIYIMRDVWSSVFRLKMKMVPISTPLKVFITLFNEGKDIDYWSPSSFHNGPPTIKVIKSIDYLINYQYNLPTKIT